MSLDVYLRLNEPIMVRAGSGIFIRENGEMREITLEEWNERHPDKEPVRFEYESNEYETDTVYSANITHNLNTMADVAGIYEALWRPYKLKNIYFKFGKDESEASNLNYDKEYEIEQNTIVLANDLIEPLRHGLHELKLNPDKYKTYNPENGWGSYDGLVRFVENYLNACYQYPNAKVEVSR